MSNPLRKGNVTAEKRNIDKMKIVGIFFTDSGFFCFLREYLKK